MLNVKVNAYQKALIFRNGKYIRLLDEGRYWFIDGDRAIMYDMVQPFNTPVELNILMQDDAMQEALLVIEVANNEIALLYENGLFKKILTAGRYAFWKGIVQYDHIKVDLDKYEITENIDRAVLARPEVMQYIRVYNVEPYEKGLLYVNGVFEKELAAGIYYFWRNQAVLTVYKIDTRIQQMEMNGQEILTKDKANLRINFSIRYQVNDIYRLEKNKEYDKQLYLIVQFALREQITAYTFDELLEKRDAISAAVLGIVKEKAAAMGITVADCGIRDIILPGDVKDIVNQVLIAEKKAQANIITRREETASTRSLLNTARLMEENTMLFKLKEMEYVEKIADKINSISVSGGDIAGQLKQIFTPG